MDKKVLIVILVYNGAQYLRDCLSSVAKIDYPADKFEVVVIDNASADNSVEYIKNNFGNFRLFPLKENIGFAAGNNIGLQYGIDHGFDYVYLLNQDTAVEPDFLAKALNVAESDNKIGAVQSKLLLYQDKNKINSIGNEIHYLGFAFAGGYQLPDKTMPPREITYPSGACTLFRVAALKEVGLLNPDFFMYHEDADLGWRLWLGGWRIMLAPDSVVYHKYEFSRSIKKYYYMERNRYLVLLQNYKMATLILIMPAAILMDIAMFFYSFIAGFWREEFKVYRYFFQPRVWGKIVKTREDIQKKRKVKDKEIIKRFCGKIEFQDLNNPLLTKIVNPVFDWYWHLVKPLIKW